MRASSEDDADYAALSPSPLGGENQIDDTPGSRVEASETKPFTTELGRAFEVDLRLASAPAV